MWGDDVAVVGAATTPSSETIQVPQWPEVTVLGRQGHKGYHGSLVQTVPCLDGWFKFRAGEKIILPPGQHSPGRGDSVIGLSQRVQVLHPCGHPQNQYHSDGPGGHQWLGISFGLKNISMGLPSFRIVRVGTPAFWGGKVFFGEGVWVGVSW